MNPEDAYAEIGTTPPTNPRRAPTGGTPSPRHGGPAHPHVSDGGREKRRDVGSASEGAELPPASSATHVLGWLYLAAIVPASWLAFAWLVWPRGG